MKRYLYNDEVIEGTMDQYYAWIKEMEELAYFEARQKKIAEAPELESMYDL